MTVILKRSNSAAWRVPKELSLDLRATALTEMVATAVIEHLKASALAGVSPVDGTPHTPLDRDGTQGRRAAKGLRPTHRGSTGRPKGLPFAIKRFKGTKHNAPDTMSEVVISVGASPTWLEKERADGNVFISTEGNVQTAIDAAVAAWKRKIVEGK